jgi:RNA polymerase sigma-70 factor (ECF subfamily)
MNNAISDDELVRRVRSGDTGAYGGLALRYHRRLRLLAQRFMKHGDEAEDAVQGAHVLALRHIHQYSGQSTYLSWMSAITVNECFTQIRKRKTAANPAGDEEIETVRSSARDPEGQAIDNDFDGMLRGAMAHLPEAYGVVFQLREMESLSTAETGERLGLTEGCVKTRLLRARLMLRQTLAPAMRRTA